MEALWAAVDAIRNPGRFALDIFELEPQRLARQILDPLGAAGVEWRYGRMVVRRSPAQRMALRWRGGFKDLAKDAWRAFLFDDEAGVDWFLQDCMRLYPSSRPGERRTRKDLRDALLYVLEVQWAQRPARDNHADPKPWFDPNTENPKGYLYRAVLEEAKRRYVRRAVERREEAERAKRHAKVHKPLNELTHAEERLVAEQFDEAEFAAKESVREQMEEAIAEKVAALGLTPREAEVLRLAAWDKDNTEIGDELGIAAETVRVHRKNIRDKAERADAC